EKDHRIAAHGSDVEPRLQRQDDVLVLVAAASGERQDDQNRQGEASHERWPSPREARGVYRQVAHPAKRNRAHLAVRRRRAIRVLSSRPSMTPRAARHFAACLVAVAAVTTFTLFRVGSRDEQTGRTGISHLFEHMMFNGAAKYGRGEFDRALESRGGTSNAFTTEDLTGYFDTFPSDALELVFDLEADRMAALRIDEAALASEREVVKEERRLRIDNDVQGGMLELLNALVYLAHPYRWPIVGFMDDLDAITVEDCREYFRTRYAPNNATLFVAGDVEPARVFALARAAYASIPSQPPPPRRTVREPEQAGERRAVLRRPAQLPQIMVAWPVPGTAGGAADVPVLDLIETVLGGGESSRL